MKPVPGEPRPLLRVVGERPADGDATAPVPVKLAGAIRDYAISRGMTIGKLERSRARFSASLYLTMSDATGRIWTMRISNHLRPRVTGYALPNIDLVTFDGVSGKRAGRELIDRIITGNVVWFDASKAARCLPHTRRRKGMRQCRR